MNSFLAVLAAMVSSKKLLGAWLVLLTVAVGTVGEKVYVARTSELAVIETKLDAVKESLGKVEETTKENNKLLIEVLKEQERVKTELEAHERNSEKRSK